MGSDYGGDGYDTGALASLMEIGTDDDIDRRWRAALVAKYPRCATLKELRKHWNHFAAKSGAAPPAGAAGRRVGAEQTDWTGQEGGISNEF